MTVGGTYLAVVAGVPGGAGARVLRAHVGAVAAVRAVALQAQHAAHARLRAPRTTRPEGKKINRTVCYDGSVSDIIPTRS